MTTMKAKIRSATKASWAARRVRVARKLTASDRTDVAYAITYPTGTIMKILLIQVMLAMMGRP